MKLDCIIAIIAMVTALICSILAYTVPGISACIVFIVATLDIMIASGVKNRIAEAKPSGKAGT